MRPGLIANPAVEDRLERRKSLSELSRLRSHGTLGSLVSGVPDFHRLPLSLASVKECQAGSFRRSGWVVPGRSVLLGGAPPVSPAGLDILVCFRHLGLSGHHHRARPRLTGGIRSQALAKTRPTAAVCMADRVPEKVSEPVVVPPSHLSLVGRRHDGICRLEE